MILNCTFEELRALASGAELVLADCKRHGAGNIVAPIQARAEVEKLALRLEADLDIQTLAEQRSVRRAVAAICDDFHDKLEDKLLQFHPAHDDAISLYFDYGHVFAVLARLDEMGVTMSALIELMTGAPVTDEAAATITFGE